jgi:enoyl-CoA hydratase/carnithine racemase
MDTYDVSIGLEIAGGVARITIDRPAHLNALNEALRGELAEAVERAVLANARVMLLTGAGGRAFVAGADLEELIDLDPAQALEVSVRIAAFHDRLEALSIPVVAAIRGWCLGGGLELALACDIRIASDTARFGLPEIKLGILPGGGGITRVLRRAPAAAAYLCLTGNVVTAERALQLGLVNELVIEDGFDARVEEVVASLSALDPAAIAAMKAALRVPLAHAPAEATRAEARIGAELYGKDAQREAMGRFMADRARRRSSK